MPTAQTFVAFDRDLDSRQRSSGRPRDVPAGLEIELAFVAWGVEDAIGDARNHGAREVRA